MKRTSENINTGSDRCISVSAMADYLALDKNVFIPTYQAVSDLQLMFKYVGIFILTVIILICTSNNTYGQLNPKVIQIDKCPKPQVINVPVKEGGSYYAYSINATPKIDLKPPVVNFLNLDGVDAQALCFFTNYSSDDGLAMDAVSCNYRDRMGNIWFGTFGAGLSRFDGKTFTNFNTSHGLISNFILCITEDNNGNMLFGTSSGVSRFNGTSFVNFDTADGLANNKVLCIFADKSGNLWIGTEAMGLDRYDGKTFTNFTKEHGLLHNTVTCITEDTQGILWIGTVAGLNRYDGKTFTGYTFADGLSNNYIRCLLIDNKNNLWVGTANGLNCFDGSTFISYGRDRSNLYNNIRCLKQDKKGNIWFGTNACLSRFDGNSIINFTTDNGLEGNKIHCITDDETGNLWIGTNGGFSRYGGNSIINYTTSNGLSNNIILSIAEDRLGRLWFGTYGGGVNCYDGKSFTIYSANQGLNNNVVIAIAEDRTGKLWFGTYGGGIISFDGKSFTHYTDIQGLPCNIVYSIREDKKGDLWIGTERGGVIRYDGSRFTNYTTNEGLASNSIRCITEDSKGHIWFGTYGGGISRFDGNKFESFTTSNGLANNFVWSICEGKNGQFWFGTEGGLSRFDGKSFCNFTVTDGLSDNVITNIFEDEKGRLFLGTNNGINVITGWNNNAPVIEILNTKTGLPLKDINMGQNAMFKDSKGVIWAGTGSNKTGLARINYELILRNERQLPVLVNKIKINNESVSWKNLLSYKNSAETKHENLRNLQTNDSITISRILIERRKDSLSVLNQEAMTFNRFLTDTERLSMYDKFGDMKFDAVNSLNGLPENLELPYDNNNVTFEFTSVETAYPFLVKYQYILEGYDKNWSPATDRTSASFGNIREGKYTFKLRASRNGVDWSEPVNYTFTVLPPWYRTWWSYVLYLLLTVLIIYLAIKRYTNSLIKQKSQLEKLVQERSLELEDKVQKLKKTNEELIYERKKLEVTNEELEIFCCSVSHDLRAPLRAINGFTGILSDNHSSTLDKEGKRILKRITENAGRMDTLINDLLKFSRYNRQEIKLSRVNMYSMASAVYKDLSTETDKNKIKFHLQNIPETYGDYSLLQQVWINLIGNAIKYTSKNPNPEIEVGYRTENTENIYFVKDNGVGFDMAYVKKLFCVFQRLHTNHEFEGTGMGLANVHRIITRMNGRVWAEGKVNEGATFYFALPSNNIQPGKDRYMLELHSLTEEN